MARVNVSDNAAHLAFFRAAPRPLQKKNRLLLIWTGSVDCRALVTYVTGSLQEKPSFAHGMFFSGCEVIPFMELR